MRKNFWSRLVWNHLGRACAAFASDLITLVWWRTSAPLGVALNASMLWLPLLALVSPELLHFVRELFTHATRQGHGIR
jgi:hypothetical protein